VVFGLLPSRWREPHRWTRSGRFAPLVAGVAAVAAGVLVVRHGNPWNEQHIDEPSRRLVEHLSQPIYRDAVILAKPSRTLPPDWLLEGHARFLALPDSVSDEEAPRWITQRAQYLLTSPGLRDRRPGLLWQGVRHSIWNGSLRPHAELRTVWSDPASPYQLDVVVAQPVPR
jgi:hypothetical protein